MKRMKKKLIRGLGELSKIRNPREYFDGNRLVLEEVVGVVRRAFGREMDFEDVYNHVTHPQEVFLLRDNLGKLIAMRSHNRVIFSGLPSLVLEGAAIDPEYHGRGVYQILLSEIDKRGRIMFLRTQNPRVYAAFSRFCDTVYPNERETPEAIAALLKAFSEYLRCKTDENFVVKGQYGHMLYGNEPSHKDLSDFFNKKLGMDLSNGDAVLLAGIK